MFAAVVITWAIRAALERKNKTQRQENERRHAEAQYGRNVSKTVITKQELKGKHIV